MFSGIIEEVGKVASTQPGRLAIAAHSVIQGVQLGDSMAVNGVCLTVTIFDARSFAVDVMPETLKRSNLGSLQTGDKVNLERALALGGRIGGHLVEGHIDATGRVVSLRAEGEAILVRIEAPPEVLRYVVEKGFIAVDGISLTVVTRDASSFQISMVEYTRQHTNLGERQVGDRVNLEVDIIAKYVEQYSRVYQPGVTTELLREHGFLTG